LLGAALQAGQRVRAREVTWQPGDTVGAAAAQDAGTALTSAMGR
jgi:hypothetical protein